MPRLPKDALLSLISDLTVTDWSPNGWPVVWEVDPIPLLGIQNDTLGAFIELSVNSYKSVGVDELKSEFSVELDALQSVYYGLRQFTLTLDCRSFAAHIMAIDILESVRLRINNPGTVLTNQYFTNNGLSWIRSHPTVKLPGDYQVADSRMTWRASIDIEFSWLSAAQVPVNGGIIETVGPVPNNSPIGTNDVTGVISNPDGNPWPTP